MAKPEPKLSHMPRHIKETIVDDLDTETKLSLREVDREFKEVVGNSRTHYEKLTLSLSTDKVEVHWQKTKKELVQQIFKPKGNGYVMTKWEEPIKTGEGDYRKAAVVKMLRVFKNPKITVGELVMEDVSDDHTGQRFEADRAAIFEEIERILPLKTFRLRVEKLEIGFRIEGHMLLSVLSFLEPGILKVLLVNNRWLDDWDSLETPTIDPRIADMEQWKQLKEVDIDDSICLDIPIEKYIHFEKIELNFSRRPTETAKTILEKVLQKPTMKECILWIFDDNDGFDMTGVQEYLDQLEKIPGDYDYFKHPYEAGKRVQITIDITCIEITSG